LLVLQFERHECDHRQLDKYKKITNNSFKYYKFIIVTHVKNELYLQELAQKFVITA